jgi:hypothetical protein
LLLEPVEVTRLVTIDPGWAILLVTAIVGVGIGPDIRFSTAVRQELSIILDCGTAMRHQPIFDEQRRHRPPTSVLITSCLDTIL